MAAQQLDGFRYTARLQIFEACWIHAYIAFLVYS
jgi:hypothetical protein